MLHRVSVVFALLVCALANSQNTVSDARYAHLARGVNLNNVFQYGDTFQITQQDVDLLKSNGFTCVRLPVAPEDILFNFTDSQTTIDSELKRLDSIVDMLVNAGIAVMLDFHADGPYVTYYFADNAAPQELISTWQMLANRYKNRDPDLLFFEIMNEPTNQFTEAEWDAEQTQVLQAIHAIAPDHTVLVTPVDWSGLDGLVGMTPYSDTNVIYVLHDYNPMTFTHQGANWVGSTAIENLRGVPYPSYLPDLQTLIDKTTDADQLTLLKQYQADDWTEERMNWDLQLAEAWAKKWDVRVEVNEFGAYKTYSPPDSRARWIYDMRTALGAAGFGWSMWDYESGFDLATGNSGSRALDPAIAGALGVRGFNAPAYPQRTGSPPAFTGVRSVQIGGAPVGNGYAEGLVVTDLNGDGLPDLVMTPINWPTLPAIPVQIFLNQGGGLMSPAPFNGSVPTQKFASAIVPGKFDKSGHLGVFFPDQGPTDGSGAQSRLVLPNGGASWTDATGNLPQQKTSTIGAAAGDVNGDGVDDLAVFYGGSNPLPMQLLRNNGSGVFANDANAFPAWVTDLMRGDNLFTCGVFVPREGTGVNDLVVVGWNGTPGRVFLNDGSGHFSNGAFLPPPLPAVGGPATGGCAATADLDRDGNVDVILGFAHTGSGAPDVVQILMNNGDGTFHDETDLRIGALPASNGGVRRISLATGGATRALLLTRVGDPPLVMVDDGDGVFVNTSTWNSAGAAGWVIAGGDLKNDGLIDFVYGEGGGGATVQAQFARAAMSADGAAPPAVTHPFAFHSNDAAAYSPVASPGQWMAVFGANILPAGTADQVWNSFPNGTLPTTTGGVSVTVGGKPASVYFVSTKQINVQVPDIPTGDYAPISITTPTGTANSTILVQALAPELFTIGQSSQGDTMVAARAADGTLIGDPAVFPKARAAHAGETVEIYGTGFGATNPASAAGVLITSRVKLATEVTVTLAGSSSTATGYLVGAGLNQVNIHVPAGLAPGSYTLQMSVGGVSTQTGVKLLVD